MLICSILLWVMILRKGQFPVCMTCMYFMAWMLLRMHCCCVCVFYWNRIEWNTDVYKETKHTATGDLLKGFRLSILFPTSFRKRTDNLQCVVRDSFVIIHDRWFQGQTIDTVTIDGKLIEEADELRENICVVAVIVDVRKTLGHLLPLFILFCSV